MRRRTLVLIGLLVFGFTLVMQTPAVQLYRLVAPRLAASGVALVGLDGTLSAGRVAQVERLAQPLLRDVTWTLNRLQLLMGRASFDLQGGRDGTLIQGTAFVVPSGTLHLRNLRLVTPLKDGAAALGFGFLPVDGQASVDLERLALRQGWPQQAQGRIALRGLSWKLGREPVLFGDYEALIETETAGLKATVRHTAGTLEVSGDARLALDGRYELNLQMRPRPDAPPMVANLVRNLGQPDAQGWFHVRRSGQAAGAPHAAGGTP